MKNTGKTILIFGIIIAVLVAALGVLVALRSGVFEKPEEPEETVCEHVYGMPFETVAATCEAAGYAKYKCKTCEEIKTVTFPAGHAFETVLVEPTCTSQGKTVNVCKTCGFEDPLYRPYPASLHTGVCGEACSVCDNVITHRYVDGVCVYCQAVEGGEAE